MSTGNDFDSILREYEQDPEFARDWAIEQAKTVLGVNVFRLRRDRGLTQDDLARAAGMRQPQIAGIERGDANPRLETVAKIAHALGVTVDALTADPDRAPAPEYSARIVARFGPLDFSSMESLDWGTTDQVRAKASAKANELFSLVA